MLFDILLKISDLTRYLPQLLPLRSPDGEPAMKGCKIIQRHYADHPECNVDVVFPETGLTNNPLAYIHGGGHIAVHTDHVIHSITPFVRKGYSVYVIGYPKSPNTLCPDVLLRVIQGLMYANWHYGTRGSSEICLLGDSAGGNIATMVTALIHNRELLEDMKRRGSVDIGEGTIPTISKLCVVYGLVGRLYGLFGNSITNLYVDDFENECFLLDIIPEKLKKYARQTLFVCGRQDFLLDMNEKGNELLQEAGHDSRIVKINGYHGWFSIPFNMNPFWTQDVISATETMISFFETK